MRLEKIVEDGLARHYLKDRPVHCGAILELETDAGHWTEVRFEADFRGPVISVTLFCASGWLKPSADANFRWPGKDGAR